MLFAEAIELIQAKCISLIVLVHLATDKRDVKLEGVFLLISKRSFPSLPQFSKDG